MNDDDGGRRPNRRPTRNPNVDRDGFANPDHGPTPGKSTRAEGLPPAHPAAVAARAVRAAHGAAARVESWAPQLMDRVAAADYLESGRLSFEIRSSLRRAEAALAELDRSDPQQAASLADQIAAARDRLAGLGRELAVLLRAAPVIEAPHAGTEASERTWTAGRSGRSTEATRTNVATTNTTRDVTPADLERAVIAAGQAGAGSEDRFAAVARASELAGFTHGKAVPPVSFPAADILAGPYVVALDAARRAGAWGDDVAELAPRIGVAGVTIVADDTARRITDAKNARGVAFGDAIYLHPDRAVPGTAAGREVLAHELVHLAQSRLSGVAEIGTDDRQAAEDEAATLAPRLARGESVGGPTRHIDLRRAAADSDAPLPFGLQALFDGQLLAALEVPVAAGDERAAVARVETIEAIVRGLPPLACASLHSRLEHNKPDDTLAATFRRRLSRHSRARVLQVVRERARSTESSRAPTPAPAIDATGAASGGSEAMWRQTIGEKSTEVGKLARVARVKGVGLFDQPAPDATPATILPFNALVQVQRRTMHGWCWVVATGASGGVGFVPEQHLAIDPPEPTAELHPVSPGERLGAIADRYYGSSFGDGNDARLYVQALYLANKNRRGVYLDDVELGIGSTWHRGADEERTLEIYRGAKVRSGHTIWVPSEAFVQALKSSGAITSGTSTISQVWNKAKQLVGDVIDAIAYAAGFVIGFLDGAWTAITDLFDDAAELISIIAKTIWHLITGNPGRIKTMLSSWANQLEATWANRADIAGDLLAQWTDDSAWDRGLFQGKALGWVAMTALLAAVSGGVALAVKAGRFATIASALDQLGALGDVTTYVGKGIRLPGDAADAIRKRLGGDTSATTTGGERTGRGDPAPIPDTTPSPIERSDTHSPARRTKRSRRQDASAGDAGPKTHSARHAEAAAELAKIQVTVARSAHSSRGYRVTHADGRRMTELFRQVDGAQVIEYKAGLLVRVEGKEWYFEFDDRAHAIATGERAAAHDAESGLPAPNVATVELVGYTGVRRIHGRPESEWTAAERAEVDELGKRDPLIIAGHVAISFDGGKNLYGMTPRTDGMPLEDVIARLKRNEVFPGKVENDNKRFALAQKQAREKGWDTEPVRVIMTFDPTERQAIQQRVLGEVKTNRMRQHRFGYSWPAKKPTDGQHYPGGSAPDGQDFASECVGNCAIFPAMVGVPIPERSGRMQDYKKELVAWANADAPIAGHTTESEP